MPGTLADNCAFLSGRVNEVGLLFFQAAESLVYGKAEIPAALGLLPLTFHLHLPIDMPIYRQGATDGQAMESADICLELLNKIKYLNRCAQKRQKLPAHCPAVLHPPAHEKSDTLRASRLLDTFAARFSIKGGNPSLLLLENVRDNDLTGLQAVIKEYGFGVCPDLGHLLAYEQASLLNNRFLLERAGIVHLNAPGKNDRPGAHLPLSALDSQGRKACMRLLDAVPETAVIMLELFNWQDIEKSLPLIHSWLLPLP